MSVTHQYQVSPTNSMALVLDIIFPGILQLRMELHSGAQLVGKHFPLLQKCSLLMALSHLMQRRQARPPSVPQLRSLEIQGQKLNRDHKAPKGVEG